MRGHVAASPYTLKVVDGSDFDDSYGDVTGEGYQKKLHTIIKDFTQKIKGYEIILEREVKDGDVKALLDCKSTIHAIQSGNAEMMKHVSVQPHGSRILSSTRKKYSTRDEVFGPVYRIMEDFIV